MSTLGWFAACAALLLVVVLGMQRRLMRLKARYERLLQIEQRRAAEYAQQQQSFLQAIQASPNGVVILDAQQRIEWCNETAAQLLGLDAKRDTLQLITNLVRHPNFVAYVQAHDFSSELRFDNKAVRLHAFEKSNRDGGSTEGALLLVRDVTELARAEQMQRDFVANVSHEIRTPLTVLAGFIETLQTLTLAEQERQHYLGLMGAQCQRLHALVADLLMLSKLEASGRTEKIRVDVPQLLRDCESEARQLAQLLRRDLAITFEIAPECVLGCAPELRSAFSNLITNAVRYTPPGGWVKVRWCQRVLSVSDSGIGIAPEHLPRITERFYRVERSRNRGLEGVTETGTGLGLALVQQVAQQHGATLEIDSTPGVGSCFRLRMPQSLAPADAQQRHTKPSGGDAQ